MSLKTVGTALTRTILARGHGTPPVARSTKVNRLSTSCSLLADRQQGQSHEQISDRPTGDSPSPTEPPHMRASADKKRAPEPVGAPGVPGVKRRSFTSDAASLNERSYLWARYNDMKRMVHDLIPPGACKSLNSATIYANNEVNLAEVDIYGFDYDYTLAQYSDALNVMIYNTAKRFLIEHFKYPEGIHEYEYVQNFATRGLHYDIQKGLLMKIDAFHYIESGTVYR